MSQANVLLRGYSSTGRALRSHRRGRGFESPYLHQKPLISARHCLGALFVPDTSRDGRLVLIECNHRFTASTALHLAAGLDVPLFVYNRLVGAPTPRLGRPYNETKTLWYPLDDYRAFKEYRRRGELTTVQYLRSIARLHAFSVASLSDPGPLLLNGPNVKFTSADQLLSRAAKDGGARRLRIGIGVEDGTELTVCFHRPAGKPLDLPLRSGKKP